LKTQRIFLRRRRMKMWRKMGKRKMRRKKKRRSRGG